MPYSELVSLAEELDTLLQILLKLINLKKLQAKLFVEKVGEILRRLEMGRTTTVLEQLVEEILPLALPIGDDIVIKLGWERKSWFPIGDDIVPQRRWETNSCFPTLRPKQSWSSDIKNILSTHNPWIILREVPDIVEQLNLIKETQLEKFLDDSDLYDNWEELRNNLEILTCREAVRNLVQTSQELKEALNFFHDVGTEKTILSQYLHFLMTLLEDSDFSDECNGLEMVKSIRDVASKALDAVNSQYKDSLHSQMERLEKELSMQYYYRRESVRKKKNGIEEVAKGYFEGKNGIRLVLLDTLGKLHSFKGEIDMICKKLGKEEFQAWNASLSWTCSQPFSVFPSPKERKRKEMLPEKKCLTIL